MTEPDTTSGGCDLSLDHYRDLLKAGQDGGYQFLRCGDWRRDPAPPAPTAVLRHDVESHPARAARMGELEAQLGIRSTFFVRVHANEYNPLGFETLAVVRDLHAMGHEIGLHAEPTDVWRATGLDRDTSIRIGMAVLAAAIGAPIEGMASHRDVTPDNNLEWLSSRPASSFGLRYEAYGDELGLFRTSTYVTDGHFWYWRRFENGVITDDQSCLCRHFLARRPRLYALVHPNVWYDRHYHRVNY